MAEPDQNHKILSKDTEERNLSRNYQIDKANNQTTAYGIETGDVEFSITKQYFGVLTYSNTDLVSDVTARATTLDCLISVIPFAMLDRRNPAQVYRSIRQYRAKQRQGTASTKTRSEVRGGGKKPHQQKGTGRARAGSSRSPLWKGGGVTFGPKPKSFNTKLNKKELEIAIQTVIANRMYNGEFSRFINFDNLEETFIEPKTKIFLEKFSRIVGSNNRPLFDLSKKIVVIVTKKTESLILATRNMRNVKLMLTSNIDIVCLLEAQQYIVSSAALKVIKEAYFTCRFFAAYDEEHIFKLN
jgi:large subunit ribosomal protein L4